MPVEEERVFSAPEIERGVVLVLVHRVVLLLSLLDRRKRLLYRADRGLADERISRRCEGVLRALVRWVEEGEAA